jgi:hypothetical protein
VPHSKVSILPSQHANIRPSLKKLSSRNTLAYFVGCAVGDEEETVCNVDTCSLDDLRLGRRNKSFRSTLDFMTLPEKIVNNQPLSPLV